MKSNSFKNHRTLSAIVATLLLFSTMTASGASNTTSNSAGYLICIKTKPSSIFHPVSSKCPKGSKSVLLGVKGKDGIPGLNGATGLNGRDGQDGKTLWNGNQNPANDLGVPGDFYINSVTSTLFGPKNVDNTWKAGVSLVGPKGDPGPTGAAGATGATGAQGPAGATGATGVAEPVTSGGNCTSVGKCSFKIGDTGPAGGTIFYVDFLNQYSGFNYLEAAPSSCGSPSLMTWASESITAVMPTSWSNRTVGAGADLTARIISLLPRDNFTNNAAWFATSCSATTSVGTGGWFLGSVGEMKLLNDNLQGLAGLFATFYWTSSENGATSAWFVGLSNNSLSNASKSTLYRVIPIRSFQ